MKTPRNRVDDTATVEQALQRVFEAIPVILPDGRTVVTAHHNDVKLDVRSLGERAVARHEFVDLDSLADWLVREARLRGQHVAKRADVLVSAGVTVASLDVEDVEPVRVSCPMQTHPRLTRWELAFGKELSQKDFQRLLLTARKDFRAELAVDGTVLGTEGDAIAAQVAKFGYTKTANWKVERNRHGMVTFAGGDSATSVNVQLPPRLTVNVPWFIGVCVPGSTVECEYELELELEVDIDGDEPTFVVTFPGRAEVQLRAIRDAAAHLRERLGSDWLVTLGKYSTGKAPITKKSREVDVHVHPVKDPSAFLEALLKATAEDDAERDADAPDSPTLTPEQAADLAQRGTVTPIPPDAAGEVADD